nr:hypothetical protein [uncultured Eisenbergiella sp.]
MTFFKQAKPVWLAGRETEKNCGAGFVCRFSSGEVTGEELVLSIASSGIYRACLNGDFLGHGPARAAHGYFRVDRIGIPVNQLQKDNILTIEVLSFCVNSFYIPDQPGFLQAELRCEDKILRFTDTEGTFQAHLLKERRQRVQRYSFQRPFIEAFRLEKGFDDWKKGLAASGEPLCRQEEKRLLERRVPWPLFPVRPLSRILAGGTFASGRTELPIWKDRALFEIGDTIRGFPIEELEEKVSVILDGCSTLTLTPEERPVCLSDGQPLLDHTFFIADAGRNTTGFIGISLECTQTSQVYITFDEVLLNGDVSYNRMSCVNAISLDLKPGSYVLETIQPYTCRYMKPMVFSGGVTIRDMYIRELKNPDVCRASFSSGDEALNRIYEAGRETFAQNALDVYMDCPSRERAGWLCDSFFTARTEMDLTGNHLVEDNFLENYLLPEHFQHLPQGMVPMCYPSDHTDGVYIANWALWFILELYEYRFRSPGSSLIPALEKRVDGILSFLAPLENEDGLLEDVPGWVFVEWSKANELTDGVNYPSNMLYSAALLAAASLYQKEEYREKGVRIRRLIQEQSYDGRWFCDHALRVNGKLVRQPDATEVCQYYAFFFGIAQKKEYPALYSCLMDEFGPDRESRGLHPDIWPANAFIGNYLRMELLSQAGRPAQLLREAREYFDYMALKTGTLWENTGDYASCNHGFASHILHCFYRDILGVAGIENHLICLSFHDLPLTECRGTLPTADGPLSVEWIRSDNTIRACVHVPEGFQIQASCTDGLLLELQTETASKKRLQ